VPLRAGINTKTRRHTGTDTTHTGAKGVEASWLLNGHLWDGRIGRQHSWESLKTTKIDFVHMGVCDTEWASTGALSGDSADGNK
jgi:hypothetical protein